MEPGRECECASSDGRKKEKKRGVVCMPFAFRRYLGSMELLGRRICAHDVVWIRMSNVVDNSE